MNNWKCGKCKVEMIQTEEIPITFADLDLPDASGFRCPECAVEFLDGEYVLTELASAEQMLEGK